MKAFSDGFGWYWVAGVVIGGFLARSVTAQGPEIRWQPVDCTGSYSLVDNEGNPGVPSEIIIAEGVEVTLEMHVSGWGNAPGNPELGCYCGTVDSSGYASGIAGTLNPKGWPDTPEDGAFILYKMCSESGTLCDHPLDCPPGESCIENPAFVFSGLGVPVITATSTVVLDYEWGAVPISPPYKPDDGAIYYGATLILEVPSDADGTYTIDWNPSETKTFFNDQNAQKIPGLTRTPVLITIGAVPLPCCLPDKSCTEMVEAECLGSSGEVVPDCLGDGNANGFDDACEDCDDDGIPDRDETDPAQQDCDFDDICNGVEIANCPPETPACDDCNTNSVPDECDINDGTSADDNENGVPDECETDSDNDGVVDAEDNCPNDHNPNQDNSDTDDLGNACDNCPNHDNPGQDDCDEDGYGDVCAIAEGFSQDCNANGIPDTCDIRDCPPDTPACANCNGGNVPDQCDIDEGTSADCSGNGIPDECEPDCNGTGAADSCDILEGTSEDCQPNGVPDECDIAEGTSQDCTGDDVPDECEPDCNNNGVADSCDIDAGTSDDCQPDGIPDDCQIGACCLDEDGDETYEACAEDTAELCALANGIWRGACRSCPDQNAAIIPEPGGEVFVHVIGAPIDCLAETRARRRDCNPEDPKIDAWKSDEDAQMCHNFGVTGSPPIPVDFFCPDTNPTCGSDAFEGSICLKGVSLEHPDFPEADTLIERVEDPFDRCAILALPATADPIAIEIAALSLVSINPITVTYNGGQDPELWNVTVDLSAVHTDGDPGNDPPIGTLTATKTHCNGGTYTSVLHVYPRLTFTKDGDPGEVRVLDTGLEGDFDCITLDQQDPAPWISDIDPSLGLTGDPCSDFHAGIADDVEVMDCDCNGNVTRDTCDIEDCPPEDPDCQDCNDNGIPDECDVGSGTSPDCNSNGVPDECDIDGVTSADCNANEMPDECDIGGGTSVDCQPNGIPDECEADCNANDVPDDCDILSGTSDDDNINGIPDECDRGVNPPVADLVPKNRYISFRPGGAATGGVGSVVQAFRVTSPTHPSVVKWVGEPDENGIARLVVDPFYQAWYFAEVHVGDCEIVPDAAYLIQGIEEGDPIDDEVFYSDPPTEITTTPRPAPKWWADVVGAKTGPTWAPPNQVVNMDDVMAAVQYFKDDPTAPPLTWVDVDEEVPNIVLNFTDIQRIVQGFKGEPYPFRDPADCDAPPLLNAYSNSGCLPGTEHGQREDFAPCGDDEIEFTVTPGILGIAHRNATYNCCPDDIVISMSIEGTTIHLTEAEILTDPCYCICCYNVEATVVNLTAGSYTIEFCWYDYETDQETCHTEDILIP